VSIEPTTGAPFQWGLTAEQEIRRDALREAVAFAGEAIDWDDVRDGVTEILATAGRFAAWIADGDPAGVDLRPVPRSRDEAEHLVAQALKDAWPGEPFGDDRVFTEQVAATAVRTLGALLREGAPAHSTAFEGFQSAVEPRTDPGEGDGKPEASGGESGAARDHAALAYSVCVPCALRQPGCGQEPELIHTGEVTA
jgi:hypothetical protein